MNLTLVEVVRKLAGPIQPVGDSHIDSQRLKNLETLINLVDILLGDIQTVASEAYRHETSIRELGIKAKEFLAEVKGADVE